MSSASPSGPTPRSPSRPHEVPSFSQQQWVEEQTRTILVDGEADSPRLENIPDELIGSQLGQYKLLRPLGEGSMGRVYQAEHVGLMRSCAIKVLHPALVLAQPRVRDLFWAEARAVATIAHPHVVGIFNVGRDRGYDFLEMEYIPGGDSLKQRVVGMGPQDASDCIRWTWQIAQGLGAAHGAGLIHRDVKPNNVLLTPDGRAKLADFGLVRHLRGEEGAGVISGTPAYMAPELFDGVAANAASDLYALGVTLYYLLTARLPYAASSVGKLIQLHRKAPLPDVREAGTYVPEIVAEVVRRCLAKDPAERYSSAASLGDALRMVLYSLRDIDDLVADAVDGLDSLVQGGNGQFRVYCRVPEDRIQEVYIDTVQTRGGTRLVSVYSICAAAEPRYFEYALRLNAELCHGGISLREINGQPMFVMTRAFPLERVTANELRAAIREIAHRADAVEAQLTGHDLY